MELKRMIISKIKNKYSVTYENMSPIDLGKMLGWFITDYISKTFKLKV